MSRRQFTKEFKMEAVRRMQGGEPAAVRAPSPNPLYLNPPYLRAFGAFPSDWLAKGVQLSCMTQRGRFL